MTFNEAIGIHKCNVDTETGATISHREVYDRAIKFLGGLDEVAKYVPFPVEVIRKKLRRDQYLNNTPMGKWDKASGFICKEGDCIFIGGGIWNLYRKHGITSASCAQGVSLLKEAARQLAER